MAAHQNPYDIDSHSGNPLQGLYRITHSPQLGRFLVATRDIKRGEIILKDRPLTIGPQKGSDIVCPGCYSQPSSQCIHCGWPVCGSMCTGYETHEIECKYLRAAHPFKSCRDWNTLSDCLMIVRCLLLKVIDERKWKWFMEMETNWEKWSRSPLYAPATDIEKLLRTEFGLTEAEFPSSEILNAQAILDINAYEVRMAESNVQATYKLASLAEHNCSPNTHKTICSESLEVTFRAATDIPQGGHISTAYCDIMWPTWQRQQYLQWSKFFICKCERCQSHTELESHFGSLVCMDCTRKVDHGFVAATPDLNETKSWEDVMQDFRCASCVEQFPANECQIIFNKAENELSELDKDPDFESIHAFEDWLTRWTLVDQIVSAEEMCERQDDDKDECSSTRGRMGIPKQQTRKCYARLLLHPQHSLVLDACHTAFLLYPKEDCSIEQLKRKECFGTHLLRATRPLFTGMPKFRGTIAYELAMTKAAILAHLLEQSGMTLNLQQLAEEVLQLLGESQELLKYEPLDQPEGQLAQTGASQLQRLALFFRTFPLE